MITIVSMLIFILFLSFSQDTAARVISLNPIRCTHTFLSGLPFLLRMKKAAQQYRDTLTRVVCALIVDH
jgi:hypothetical protein